MIISVGYRINSHRGVQNKMYFAAHGHTATEVIYDRANAENDFMGLTTWRCAYRQKWQN